MKNKPFSCRYSNFTLQDYSAESCIFNADLSRHFSQAIFLTHNKLIKSILLIVTMVVTDETSKTWQPTSSSTCYFKHKPRSKACLSEPGRKHLTVIQLNTAGQYQKIKSMLAAQKTMEHQIIALREFTQLTQEEYRNRYIFTQLFLTCLHRHHNVVYEGIMFGSTVNGLGFCDSDVDLRLRPLQQISDDVYEPINMDDETRDKVLRNIAKQTHMCCPAIGIFVPSTRCPVAKLTFFDGYVRPYSKDVGTRKEGLKYDVSLSSSNPLGTFNSTFLRFLCHLEPKFHLLATVLRYWSSKHGLIVPGSLSSYALINMLIFFCQTIQPPLLPTIDQMRDTYFECCVDDTDKDVSGDQDKKGMTQLEWQCIVCMRKDCYAPSANTEPLSILLLKFFEFCLNFPYKTHIITTRPGRALTHEEFKESTQFHPRFPLKTLINIQDPFDLKHNLTSGMPGGHFRRILITIRYSYERLFKELLNHFDGPFMKINNEEDIIPRQKNAKDTSKMRDARNWGLNCLFVNLSKHELK